MLRNRLKAFRSNRNGTVMIYVALAMPVMVGGMGLGGEAGYRYYNQRILQHGADFSAYTGAVRLYKGDDKPEIDASAKHVAVSSGYEDPVGTIAVNIPPSSGAYTGDDTAVEVILEETRPRLFSAVFSQEPVIIKARAVAAQTGDGQPACVLAKSDDASGAVTVTGSTDVNLEGCMVGSYSGADDSFKMTGSGSLKADCVQTAGGIDVPDPETEKLILDDDCDLDERLEPEPDHDPYVNVMEPTFTGTCHPKQVGTPNQETTVQPTETWTHGDGTTNATELDVRRYCDGLDVKGDVTFEPGLYIIEGGSFKVNTASGTGTAEIRSRTPGGVTFYFTNGGVAQLGSQAQLNLTAPTEGPYAGILFFGDRDEQNLTHRISGTNTSTLNGAIYFPASHLIFTGNSTGTDGCTQIIADTIDFTGNSTLAITSCVPDGGKEILLGNMFALVE